MNKQRFFFIILLLSAGLLIINSNGWLDTFFDVFGAPIFLIFSFLIFKTVVKATKNKDMFFENVDIDPNSAYWKFLVLVIGISYCITLEKIIENNSFLRKFFQTIPWELSTIGCLFAIFASLFLSSFLTAKHEERKKNVNSTLTDREKKEIHKNALRAMWPGLVIILAILIFAFLNS